MKAPELLRYFRSKHEERFGKEQPLVVSWQKNSAQLKRVQSQLGDALCVSAINHYFSGYTSDFSSRLGFTVSAFVTEINSVIADMREHRKIETHTDYERLQKAREES